MKTLCIINQKGGIGKTTTAQALIEGLRARGFKVLGIDLDSQCNLTSSMGNPEATKTSYLMFTGAKAKDLIERDFISAGLDLIRVPLNANKGAIKNALKGSLPYNFAIIDTPPKLDTLTLSAIMASDYAIITTSADSFAIEGVNTALDAVATFNKSLKVLGVLLTKYNARATLNRVLREKMEADLNAKGVKVFDTTIRESVAIREAQAIGKPLFEYAKQSNAIKDYNALINEVLNGLEK